MLRLTVCILIVAVAVSVIADETSCGGGCPCGQDCNAGVCEDGCLIFDVFVPVNATQDVYSRVCECVNEVDERGRVVQCEDGTDFVDAPAGEAWTQNPNC